MQQQKSFEVTLNGIEKEYKKAVKRNYFHWLESLEQLRHDRKVSKAVQHFSEAQWKQTRQANKEAKSNIFMHKAKAEKRKTMLHKKGHNN